MGDKPTAWFQVCGHDRWCRLMCGHQQPREQGTKLVEETANNTELLASAERVDVIRLTSVLPASPYDLNGRIHSNQLGQLAIRA